MMRRIFLIISFLSISLFSMSQTRDTIFSVALNGDTLGIYFVFDNKLSNDVLSDHIVQLMFDYDSECYSDSTAMYEWNCWTGMGFESSWFPEDVSPWNPECHMTDSVIYFHREPTFSDFLIWIRKKYCK